MHRQFFRAAVVVALAIAFAGAAGPALRATGAQDAAPTLPAAPDPALCTAEPRAIEEYRAFLGTPVPAAPETFVVTAGKPADQATIDAVTATLIEAAACINAREFRRLGGLYTDAGFAEDTAGIDQGTVDFFAATHEPSPVEDRYAIFAVALVQVLSDGRVAAIVQFQADGAGGADLMLFAEEGGRYLIDHWADGPFDIAPDFAAFEDEATPETATPPA
jgi:hypothetical protein